MRKKYTMERRRKMFIAGRNKSTFIGSWKNHILRARNSMYVEELQETTHLWGFNNYSEIGITYINDSSRRAFKWFIFLITPLDLKDMWFNEDQ